MELLQLSWAILCGQLHGFYWPAQFLRRQGWAFFFLGRPGRRALTLPLGASLEYIQVVIQLEIQLDSTVESFK